MNLPVVIISQNVGDKTGHFCVAKRKNPPHIVVGKVV